MSVRTNLLVPLLTALWWVAATLPFARAQAGIVWVQPTRGVSVALDQSDNVYTVDYEQALGSEMSLTKRDKDGNLLWVNSIDQTDTTTWERASWVATDSLDNAIICGTLMSGYSNPVEAASIVAKFDQNGTPLWKNVYETNFDGSTVRKCLVDADNNIYVLGLGSGPSGYVTKVKKFSPNGDPIWSYFDSAGIGSPVNFKLSPDNNILISGRYITGLFNAYAKINLNGQSIWNLVAVPSGTVGDSAGDAAGNTYLVHGSTSSTSVIKKLGTNGTLIWEKSYAITGYRVEVGSDNQAVVSGFPNSNSPGAAFIKVNANGDLLWSNLDADGPSLGLLAHAHMLLDANNNAYLAAGTMSLMGVCKANNDGSNGWTQTISFGYAQTIAISKTDSSVYVVGGTTARIGQGNTPTLPAAPSGLAQSSLTPNSVDLRWTDNSSDENGFTVERCTGTMLSCINGIWSTRITTASNVISFTDNGLTAGTTYCWRVKAFNSLGSSPYSTTLSATTPSQPPPPTQPPTNPPIPAAPTSLQATARRVDRRTAEVRLTWTDNATNENKYEVERCTGSTCTGFQLVATLPANPISYTDPRLARNTNYRYRVRAGGSGGNSQYSNIVTVKTP